MLAERRIVLAERRFVLAERRFMLAVALTTNGAYQAGTT